MSAPTSSDWIHLMSKRCADLNTAMPLPQLVAELNTENYNADLLLRHALVHLARLHMDRVDVASIRAKLSKIRDILDEE